MIFPKTGVLLAGLVALSNAVSIRDVGFGELVRRAPQQKGGQGQQGQQGGQQGAAAAAAASKNNAATAAKGNAAATVTLDAKVTSPSNMFLARITL